MCVRSSSSPVRTAHRSLFVIGCCAAALHKRMGGCAGVWPPGFDLRDCLREEFADVPATVTDYETNQPSRCVQHRSIAWMQPQKPEAVHSTH